MKSPESIKLIFYDLDGTLVDAFEDIAAALNHGLRSLGLPGRSLAEVKSYVGNGIVKLVERGLGEQHRDRVDEALPLIQKYYEANPAKLVRPYPGVLETLARVKEMGTTQIVLTNKPHAIAIETCAGTGILPLVDRVQGESADQPLKPDPECALRFLREFGVDAREAVIVGDGKPDIDLARAAGIRAVGCTWGVSSREQMESYGAESVIDRMDDLLQYLTRR